MGEVVNLRLARKRKAREAAQKDAAGKRAKFGRTNAQKTGDTAARERMSQRLDQAKLDPKKPE